VRFMDYIIIQNEKVGQIRAKLLLDKNPNTCKAIWEKLPFNLNLARWGEELYGEIPVVLGQENSQVDCDIGDVGYWPDGKGFCIFFGRTPASKNGKPKAASPVNVFAKIEVNSSIFKQFSTFKGLVKKSE
jgi:hypothetical protein